MSSSLVFLSKDNKTPLTSTRIIAEKLDKRYNDVLALAKTHKAILNRFGDLPFETEDIKNSRDASHKTEVAYLNEQQATFLITCMKNSEKVLEFKYELVKAFFAMREKLQEEKFKSLGQEIDQLRKIKYQSELTPEQLREISTLVKRAADAQHCSTSEIYSKLYASMRVPSYRLIPKDRFWVAKMVLKRAIEIGTSHPKTKVRIEVDECQMSALKHVAAFSDMFSVRARDIEILIEKKNELARKLKTAENQLDKQVYSLMHDIGCELSLCTNSLSRLYRSFERVGAVGTNS